MWLLKITCFVQNLKLEQFISTSLPYPSNQAICLSLPIYPLSSLSFINHTSHSLFLPILKDISSLTFFSPLHSIFTCSIFLFLYHTIFCHAILNLTSPLFITTSNYTTPFYNTCIHHNLLLLLCVHLEHYPITSIPGSYDLTFSSFLFHTHVVF